MIRNSVLGLLIALLNCMVCQAQAPEKTNDDYKAWSDPEALAVKLEVVKNPSPDWNTAQLKLTVTNTSKKEIVIDSELMVGFSLRFERVPFDIIFDESKDVSLKEVKKLSKPSPEQVSRRFAKLLPGKSLSRVFDMSQPISNAHSGHMTYGTPGGGRYHVGYYYEAQDTYHFPKEGGKLEISIWYDGGVLFSAVSEFQKWYGVSEEKAGLWQGRARSNVIVIERK